MIGIKISERREALLIDAQKILEEYFNERIKMLMIKYQENDYREAVIRAFAEIFSTWNLKKKQPAVYLGISYRYSDILMGSYALRLTLYGVDFYLDQAPIERLFEPPLFFSHVEADSHEVVRMLQNTYPRICKCEEDAIRLLFISYYHAALYSLCEDLLEEIQDTTQYRELNKAESFTIFLGRWRGEGEVLYRGSANGESETYERTGQLFDSNSTGGKSGASGGELVWKA